MSLNVSSLWKSKVQETTVNSVVRRFTFNGSDMSVAAIRYGKISHDVTDIIGGNLTMEIENASQTLNSFFTNKTQFYKDGIVEFGFTGTTPNSVELLTNGAMATGLSSWQAVGTTPNSVERITTGGMESGLSSWTVADSGFQASVVGGKSGNAARLTITLLDDPYIWQDVSVLEGYDYHFETFVKAGTEATYKVQIINKDDDSVIYTSGDLEETNVDWSTSVVTSFTAPTDCNTARVELYLIGTGATDSGNNIFYDSVTLVGPSDSGMTSVAGGKSGNAARLTISGSSNPYMWQDVAVIAEYPCGIEVYVKAGIEATYRTRVINKDDDSVLFTSGDLEETAVDWSTSAVASFTPPTNCDTVRLELYLVGSGTVDSGNNIFYDSATLVGPSVIGSEDLVQIYGGELTRVRFKETTANLVFKDKLSRLHEKLIGSDESPVSFTSSNYNPADLVWFIQSSYGGISSVKSNTNPDVDYPFWLGWWQQFDDDSVVIQGHFEGETVLEALEMIAKLTDSVIYDEGDNKLDYERWTGISSFTHTLTNSHIVGKMSATVEGDEIINRANIPINYDPTSDTWGSTVTHENSASVNSYGLYEENYDDTAVWYVNSLAASVQAQRIVFRRKEPNMKIKIPTNLRYLDAVVGDMVDLTTDVYSFTNKIMTLTGYSIDLNKGTMVLEADEGFGRASGKVQGFLLDDSYWGLLDETYNPIY